MKPKLRNPQRFSSPTILEENATFFGATIKEWDRAFTGNMDKTLADVKQRASSSANKRDASNAATSDLASAVSKRLASAK